MEQILRDYTVDWMWAKSADSENDHNNFFSHPFFQALKFHIMRSLTQRRNEWWNIEELLSSEQMDLIFLFLKEPEAYEHLNLSGKLNEFFTAFPSGREFFQVIDIYDGTSDLEHNSSTAILTNEAKEDIVQFSQFLKARMNIFFSKQETELPSLNTIPQLARLAEMFKLSESELHVFALMIHKEHYSQFYSRNEIDLGETKKIIRTLFGISEFHFRSHISIDGTLVKKGLLYSRANSREDGVDIDVNESIYSFLMGYSSTPYDPRVLAEAEPSRFSRESFAVNQMDRDLFCHLSENETGTNILIYGPPGSGKTEFAKSYLSDKKPLVFKSWNRNRADQLGVALAVSSSSGRPLILDEAEIILRTKSGLFMDNSEVKKQINEILDTQTGICVFITNYIDQIDESTLRRFNQIIHFPNLNANQRREFWNVISEDEKISISNSSIAKLSNRFEVTPGIVRQAVKNAGFVPAEERDEVIKRTICSFLQASGNKGDKGDSQFTPPFDLSLIHADIDPERLAAILEPYKSGLELPGTAFLFWGLPGTGKSAFGRYMAEELGFEFIYKRASDLLSKYVGGTEQNIAEMFSTASQQKSILMIDEADSLIADRQHAVRSWETTKVNEFLSQLERHNGVVVCTTNMLTNIDHAAMRRFSWKIEFKNLRREDISRALTLYFPHQFSTEQMSQIHLVDISLGDLGAVHKRLLPRLIHKADEVTAGEILALLNNESSYREHSNNFTVQGFS